MHAGVRRAKARLASVSRAKEKTVECHGKAVIRMAREAAKQKVLHPESTKSHISLQ